MRGRAQADGTASRLAVRLEPDELAPVDVVQDAPEPPAAVEDLHQLGSPISGPQLFAHADREAVHLDELRSVLPHDADVLAAELDEVLENPRHLAGEIRAALGTNLGDEQLGVLPRLPQRPPEP